MAYLMDEYRIHQIAPDHNNEAGSYMIVLHHRQISRSVLLVTSYSVEEGLPRKSDMKPPATVIWADYSTVADLEELDD